MLKFICEYFVIPLGNGLTRLYLTRYLTTKTKIAQKYAKPEHFIG